MVGMIFTEISQTGIIPDGIDKRHLLACCLNDWGCVIAGVEVPENFGIAMLKASLILNVSGLPESFMELAKDESFINGA